MTGHIYHFVTPDYFHQFDDKEEYYPFGFNEEGFIHCCFSEQFDHVITTHLKGLAEVYILTLDTSKIKADLVVEGDGHPLGFPHIYGPINMDAIVSKELRKLS